MAIRRKKPSQPASPSAQSPETLTNQTARVNRVTKSYKGVATQDLHRRGTHCVKRDEVIRDGTSAAAAVAEVATGCNVADGAEQRPEVSFVSWPQQQKRIDATEGKVVQVTSAEAEIQQDSVCRLQSRLRNNWSKLVTDKMTVMAFARSLKGHKCPAILYCQS